MSEVLKHDLTHSAAPTTPAWPLLHADRSHEPAIDPALALLNDRLAAAERKLEEISEAHTRELAGTRVDAIEEARRDFARDEAAALARLERALDSANAAFASALTRLETLAPAMCEAALDNIFGEVGADRSQLAAAIGKQIAALRRESVAYVAVNPIDYVDASALETLKASYPALDLRADASLAAGECRIGLELGHIELSIGAYRDAVNKRLREWASA